MASKALLIFIIGAFAAPAFATDYIVGDGAGWTLGVNYTTWAQGKDFYIGDRLVFLYNSEAHNVYKVNGTAFKQCTIPPPSQALTSGNDVINLATPGKKWYICGVGQHCNLGMKLVINVWPSMAPALSPMAMPPQYKASFWGFMKSLF